MSADFAIIFDIDGTLIDSNYQHVQAWVKAIRENGINQEAATIHHFIGMGGDKMLPAAFQVELDSPLGKTLDTLHGKYFKEMRTTLIAFAKVKELMELIKSKNGLVLLGTSGGKDDVEFAIRLMDVEGLIDKAITGDQVKNTKPAPDLFAKAFEEAQKHGLNVENVIVVGDAIWDIESAHKNNLSVIGVTSGGTCEHKLKEMGAQEVYVDIEDLYNNFEKSLLSTLIKRAAVAKEWNGERKNSKETVGRDFSTADAIAY